MDARHLNDVTIDRTTLQEIPRREWEAAAPSRVLHGGLAAAWMWFLWSIGLFASPDPNAAAPVFSVVEELLMFALLGTIVAVLSTIGLALMNHRATARVSTLCALSMVVIGTTCGFAGHSISSWGSLTGSAAAIGMASIAILGRRAA